MMTWDEQVEAAARAINPRAWSEDMTVACGSGWHKVGHSSHSTCPSRGSNYVRSDGEIQRSRAEQRATARGQARRALRAAGHGTGQ